ncbi:MAG: PHP domain-containing protein [Gemmatimonadaceae bacterium]
MSSNGAPVAPPGQVDLHMHSTASDGVLPPSQVLRAASAAGLTAIALTDHDTLDGLEEAAAEGQKLGVRVVPAVELSAHDGNREIHILALHISRRDFLESRLSGFREARRTRAARIVEQLRCLGVGVSLDAVLAEAGGGAVGRPHIARAMIRGGYVADSREAFDGYLGAGRPAFVAKERLEIREAIQIAHAAGALAIWAHPGSDGRRARLEPLVALGLDGVEVRHPSHKADDIRRLGALSDFFGLVASGGSDWHGAADGPRSIGCMQIPERWLASQDQVVARRQAETQAAGLSTVAGGDPGSFAGQPLIQ